MAGTVMAAKTPAMARRNATFCLFKEDMLFSYAVS
jgi:hypothetical protein